MTSKYDKPDFLELVKSDRRAPPKPPRLLASVQQNLLDSSERLLEQLFAATDDVFYDLSKRASSNTEENLYFESMREVRIARQGISRHFLQNLRMNFHRLLDEHQNAARSVEEFSAHNLSIMEGDDLEVDLALKGMVSRARENYREPLYELTMRLDHLLLQVEITEANNPLDPEQLARAFADASSDCLEIDIKGRLIFLKLFEKHLIQQLDTVYSSANQLLLEAGILPKVPRHLRSSDESTAVKAVPTAGREADPIAGTPQGEPQFNLSLDTLVSLMSAARGIDQVQQSPTINCFIFASGNPGPVMGAGRLTSLLTRAQLVVERQLTKGPRNLLPELIQALLNKADSRTPQALAENDEAVINLVSLFFNEVLADDNLPLAIYALICRLQIPILKVALQDPTLFQNPQHPARRLVNTITAAGIGFDEDKQLERDAVYRKIVDIVQNIVREPAVDATHFERLHQELCNQIQAEQCKTGIVEKRTSQAASGRARIRSAKVNSQNLLYEKLQDVKLPWEINEFLTTAWLQVLIITQLKHGCDSTEWQRHGDAAGELIWYCQPHSDLRSVQRRERLQSTLMEQIEAGLEAAIESPDVRALKVRELQNALDRVSSAPETLAYQPLTVEQQAALGRSPDKRVKRHPETEKPSGLSREQLSAAETLEEGSWVEYTDSRSGRKQRYKLTARVDADTCVFVNRKGFKAFECSCRQLALDVQEGRAKLLDASVFFDRVMNRVVSQIRQAA